MIDDIVLALGLAAIFEGTVLALLPRHLEGVLRWLASTTREERRTVGLLLMTFGVFLAWLARSLLA